MGLHRKVPPRGSGSVLRIVGLPCYFHTMIIPQNAILWGLGPFDSFSRRFGLVGAWGLGVSDVDWGRGRLLCNSDVARGLHRMQFWRQCRHRKLSKSSERVHRWPIQKPAALRHTFRDPDIKAKNLTSNRAVSPYGLKKNTPQPAQKPCSNYN